MNFGFKGKKTKADLDVGLPDANLKTPDADLNLQIPGLDIELEKPNIDLHMPDISLPKFKGKTPKSKINQLSCHSSTKIYSQNIQIHQNI